MADQPPYSSRARAVTPTQEVGEPLSTQRRAQPAPQPMGSKLNVSSVLSPNRPGKRGIEDALLSQKQLAARWRVSPRSLEAWRAKGVGPAYTKLVGLIRYRLQDIEQFELKNLITHSGRDGGRNE